MLRARLRLLVAMPVAVLVVAPAPTAAAAWRWPVEGAVVGRFRLDRTDPYAAGHRRGIDVLAAPGATVRAACGGRVTFAGAVPRRGLGATVRCGRLAATHLGLDRLTVVGGARVAAGAPLGRLGPSGRLRLGARVAADRLGYVDPLRLLAAPPVPVGPARRRAPRLPPAARTRRAPPLAARAPRRVPPPAWVGVALAAAGLPAGAVLRRRRRRRTRVAAERVAA